MTTWQDFIALGAATAALVYLARRLRRAGGGSSAGCSACLAAPGEAPCDRLVGLDATRCVPRAEQAIAPAVRSAEDTVVQPPGR